MTIYERLYITVNVWDTKFPCNILILTLNSLNQQFYIHTNIPNAFIHKKISLIEKGMNPGNVYILHDLLKSDTKVTQNRSF